MDPNVTPLPPPPPPRERPAASGSHPPRPAGRSRIVAGALSVLAFLGLGAGMAVTSRTASSGSDQVAAAQFRNGSEADDDLAPWQAAVPSVPSQASAPTTSTHAS